MISLRLRSALCAVALGGAAVLVAWSPGPAPVAEAVGSADVIGIYRLKLKGGGFDREAITNRYRAGSLRGTATLEISRPAEAVDPRVLQIAILLDGNLIGSTLARATPTPALTGVGILVEDSLTVIGTGRSDFVNAVTLRFERGGKRLVGTWLTAFPASDADDGFAAGVGVTFKGKRLKQKSIGATLLDSRD